MNILFLDVASHSGLLACVTGERIVASRAIDHRLGDHELMPLIEDVVQEAGWALPLLTHLACIIGPGGFTSLRVGVSLINALAWGLKIPAAGIHLSDLYAARIMRGENFLWLHSTKRTELFLRGFGAWAKVWPEPVCVAIDDFLQKMRQPTTCNPQPHIYAGELLPDHCAAIEKAGFAAAAVAPLVDILPSFLASRAYHGHLLQPWYGRGW